MAELAKALHFQEALHNWEANCSPTDRLPGLAAALLPIYRVWRGYWDLQSANWCRIQSRRPLLRCDGRSLLGGWSADWTEAHTTNCG